MIKILHVDDEDDIREIARMSLELDPEFEVASAASGELALEIVSRDQPDLLLLDVMMPGMDGPETLRRIRMMAGFADVPAIFMTARSRPQDIDQLLGEGARAVIAKPFDPMALAGQLRAHLF